jgi:hypothetical protein
MTTAEVWVMRLTILAGLITGASLAMGATLNAHIKPKPIPPNSAIQIRVVAPYYMATNDKRSATPSQPHDGRSPSHATG